jgi:Putative phage holin Dp-1
MKKELYDAMKFVAQIVVPALGTLYFAFASIWTLPDVTQIVGSFTVLDTFLGALLGLSSSTYKPASDGRLLVDKTDPTKDTYNLELTTDLNDIDKLSNIVLEVKTKTLDNPNGDKK